jgi:hypothetical protein
VITLGVYLDSTKVPGVTFSSSVNISDIVEIFIAMDGSVSAQVIHFSYRNASGKDVTFATTTVNMNAASTVSVYLESDDATDIDILNGINAGIKSVVSELIV